MGSKLTSAGASISRKPRSRPREGFCEPLEFFSAFLAAFWVLRHARWFIDGSMQLCWRDGSVAATSFSSPLPLSLMGNPV